jgi:hypothetical protein
MGRARRPRNIESVPSILLTLPDGHGGTLILATQGRIGNPSPDHRPVGSFGCMLWILE